MDSRLRRGPLEEESARLLLLQLRKHLLLLPHRLLLLLLRNRQPRVSRTGLDAAWDGLSWSSNSDNCAAAA